jgi:hypothetical protein
MPILGIMASQISGHLANPSYESIATTTVGSGGASSITFSSIPATFKHLQIRGIGKPTSAGGQEVYIRYNGDSAATSYFSHQLYGNGTAAVSASYGTVNQAYITYWSGSEFGSFVCDILDYSNTNKNTTSRALGGHDLNGSGFILLRSGLWINTSAVSSINLFLSSGNFAEYSQLALYGIKG